MEVSSRHRRWESKRKPSWRASTVVPTDTCEGGSGPEIWNSKGGGGIRGVVQYGAPPHEAPKLIDKTLQLAGSPGKEGNPNHSSFPRQLPQTHLPRLRRSNKPRGAPYLCSPRPPCPRLPSHLDREGEATSASREQRSLAPPPPPPLPTRQPVVGSWVG